MRTINYFVRTLGLFIVCVMFAGNLFAAENWDILDKSIAAWNEDGGSSTNGKWETARGGTIDVTSSADGYATLTKSGNWAWFRPAVAIGNLTPATAYTVEVKVRVNSGDQAQISLRMNGGGDTFTAPIFLKYGDGATGSVSTVAGGASNAYTLNTSDWHVYRLILHAGHTTYDIYVDDVKEPVLATGNTASKTDQSGVYFGAESNQGCNIDIEYAKMGTGDITANYNAFLSSLSVDAGTLVPAFSPGITEYVCELFTADPDAVTPSATAAASELAQVTGLEQVSLVQGRGVSTITVIAGDTETKKIYTINYLKVGEDRSSLIVNNDFEYVAEGVLWNDNTNQNYPTYPAPDGATTWDGGCFRPVKTNSTTIDTHAEFYGWQMSDWNYLFINEGKSPSNSMGIGGGNATTHGTACPWLAGTAAMRLPDDFEFYQTIDKDNIAAGTYKVTCILGIPIGHLTSQRLFANQNVQFYGKEADYETNKTEGEIYSYAGYAPEGQDTGKGLKVYVTVSEDDSLKLGLRGGSKKGDGTIPTGNLPGWFKFDYFTLTKIDPAVATDARLSDITLSVGSLEFLPETYTYNVVIPVGTASVTPTVTTSIPDASVSGAEEVNVESGSGTSTIVVTALDGSTQKTYTINYTDSPTGIDTPNKAKVFCFTDGRKLTVQGVEAYAVYSVNGLKVADVTVNSAGTAVDLLPGVYVVKTKTAGAFKVVVK
jgi:hypothetical protein